MLATILVFFSTFLPSMSLCCFVAKPWRATQQLSRSVGRPTSFIKRRRIATRSPLVMMPEGPEVRTLIDQLQGGIGRRLVALEFLSGRYVNGSPPDGYTTFCASLCRNTSQVDIIEDWNCKGKFIYILLDAGEDPPKDADYQRSIWVTLGMTGRFVNEAAHQTDSRHARWYLELETTDGSETKRIYYHDARNFGTLKFCSSRQVLLDKLQSLGPDILKESTTENDFVDVLGNQRPSLNICKFLMDQSKISGIGNYILAEGLYRAGIDPFAALEELNLDQQRRLFRELQAVARESYAELGMTREKGGQYRTVEGQRGQFEFGLQCYGREYCARGKPVHKEVNGPHGRTIWYTDDQLFMSRRDRAMSSAASTFTGDSASRQSLVSPDDVSTTIESEATRSSNSTVQLLEKKLLEGLREESWRRELAGALASESFQQLVAFLADEEARGATVYPPRYEIFAALNACPFDQVKVVIVGQDPYHGPGQGHGLAFSVQKGVKAPPSLRNIFQEAMDDVGIQAPKHGNLQHWADQGVLLLNTVLTVRQGQAGSHANHGWEEFTDFVVQRLNEKRDGLVFLLWGNPAAKKASGVDETRHTIIRSSHPSPLAASKTNSPFIGSRCFSRANLALRKAGKDPIDWNVEG